MVRTVNAWFEANRWAGDAVIAGAALLVLGTMASASGYAPAAQVGFTVLLVLPLFARRSFPLPVLAATVIVCLAQLVALDVPVAGDLVIPIVVHAAAAYIPDRRWGLGALAAGVVGAGLAAVRWTTSSPDFYYGYPRLSPGLIAFGFLAGSAVVAAAYLLGVRQRDRSERAAEQVSTLAERNRLLAAEQDSRAEAAAAAERARIARELHDIVAHSLAVIVVQADGGRAAADAKPEVASEVLATIAETSRDALMQMRRMVAVLRAEPGSDVTGYAPLPGPQDLDDLVTQVRDAGLPIDFQRIGSARSMTPDTGLAVYRVVQESLTNALKHAGPAASVRIVMHYGPAEVLLTITDDGRGAAGAMTPIADGTTRHDATRQAGHGLQGMRERVELLGGHVTAGPRIGGGFEVTAAVPYGDSTAAPDPGITTDDATAPDDDAPAPAGRAAPENDADPARPGRMNA